jgi:hypothetical protein
MSVETLPQNNRERITFRIRVRKEYTRKNKKRRPHRQRLIFLGAYATSLKKNRHNPLHLQAKYDEKTCKQIAVSYRSAPQLKLDITLILYSLAWMSSK